MIDPTQRDDEIAAKVRQWYEANRETWWQRRSRAYGSADNFILSLMRVVREAEFGEFAGQPLVDFAAIHRRAELIRKTWGSKR